MDNKVQETRSITLQNKPADSSKLADFLSDCATAFKIPDDAYDDLRLALEETFINISCYAFENNDLQTINIEANCTDGEIRFTFTDSGIAFNPLDHRTDNIETDDHCAGGMGIYIIRSLTDQQQYDRVGQSNVFTLTKHYTKSHNK
jgi:serine/threonine-protein kinase RsbW